MSDVEYSQTPDYCCFDYSPASGSRATWHDEPHFAAPGAAAVATVAAAGALESADLPGQLESGQAGAGASSCSSSSSCSSGMPTLTGLHCLPTMAYASAAHHAEAPLLQLRPTLGLQMAPHADHSQSLVGAMGQQPTHLPHGGAAYSCLPLASSLSPLPTVATIVGLKFHLPMYLDNGPELLYVLAPLVQEDRRVEEASGGGGCSAAGWSPAGHGARVSEQSRRRAGDGEREALRSPDSGGPAPDRQPGEPGRVLDDYNYRRRRGGRHGRYQRGVESLSAETMLTPKGSGDAVHNIESGDVRCARFVAGRVPDFLASQSGRSVLLALANAPLCADLLLELAHAMRGGGLAAEPWRVYAKLLERSLEWPKQAGAQMRAALDRCLPALAKTQHGSSSLRIFLSSSRDPLLQASLVTALTKHAEELCEISEGRALLAHAIRANHGPVAQSVVSSAVCIRAFGASDRWAQVLAEAARFPGMRGVFVSHARGLPLCKVAKDAMLA